MIWMHLEKPVNMLVVQGLGGRGNKRRKTNWNNKSYKLSGGKITRRACFFLEFSVTIRSLDTSFLDEVRCLRPFCTKN